MSKEVTITTGECPECGNTIDFDPAMFMRGHNYCDGYIDMDPPKPHSPCGFKPVQHTETHYEFTITQTEVFKIYAKTPHDAYEQFIGADDNGQWFEGVTERDMTDEDGNTVDYEEN